VKGHSHNHFNYVLYNTIQLASYFLTTDLLEDELDEC